MAAQVGDCAPNCEPSQPLDGIAQPRSPGARVWVCVHVPIHGGASRLQHRAALRGSSRSRQNPMVDVGGNQ